MRETTGSEGRGRLVTHTDIASAHVPQRRIDVWLPPGYDAANDARYPVIYMHDGQMLFDPALAFNGEVWSVDAAIVALMRQGHIRGAVVVGIWNTPARRFEYMPQRYLATAAVREQFLRWTGDQLASPLADAYLRFIVDELKPQVDARYRTLPGRAHTCLLGSSLGGLISLYGLTEYPQRFGAAACLSTHWPAGGRALVECIAAALPPPGQHRLYFDCGTRGLDAEYGPLQQLMDGRLLGAGYRDGIDLCSRRFDGDDHTEVAWRGRVHIPLRFMLEA